MSGDHRPEPDLAEALEIERMESEGGKEPPPLPKFDEATGAAQLEKYEDFEQKHPKVTDTWSEFQAERSSPLKLQSNSLPNENS